MSDNQPPQGPPPGWQPQGQPQGPPQGPPPGWQQPQGPPPGWQQGQPPYGPPPGYGGGPGQPPYGGPPNYGPGGPGGPGDGGNGKKVALLVGGGVLAVLVLIAAVIVGVTQLGGDDDEATDDPTTSGTKTEKGGKKAGGVMSSSSSDELREELASKGWKCYDSLSEPRIVKRCFLNKPDGDSQTEGVVSLEYDSKDTVGVVQARVQSPSTAQGEILNEVAGLIGDSMLDKSGSDLQEATKSGSSESKEVKGARVSASDGYLYVYRDGYDFQKPDEAPFPAIKETQSGLSSQGLTCKTERSTLQCEGEKSGLRIRAYSSLRNGESSGGWTVTVSPNFGQNGGDIKTGAQVAADLLVAAKLTNKEGGDFLKANPTDGQSGDFAGYNLNLTTSSSGDYFSLFVSVRPIR